MPSLEITQVLFLLVYSRWRLDKKPVRIDFPFEYYPTFANMGKQEWFIFSSKFMNPIKVLEIWFLKRSGPHQFIYQPFHINTIIYFF